MRVLVSGASISGPVVAYWLARYGHAVTVVERAPSLRKTGGHAVDLYRPAMEVSKRMGVLPRVEEMATDVTKMTVHRDSTPRPVRIDLTKVFDAASDRHVEIMRDDLSEIYYGASRDDVEYLFGDSITAISADGEVTFERAEPRRFDVVIGADGLHSNVRRLVFDAESAASKFLGLSLAVLSVPRERARIGEYLIHYAPGRMAGSYTAAQLDDARVMFLLRGERPPDVHHRDVSRQQQLVREAFAGMHPEVDGWLAELDQTPAFYFDAVTQLDLPTWSRGRVALLGDAGYCPGPAVGGSTSLAVVGAYLLAGELATAGGDHRRAFATYQRELAEVVRKSHALASRAARTLVPRSRRGATAVVRGAQLASLLPTRIARAVARLDTSGIGVYDSLPVKDYATSVHSPRP